MQFERISRELPSLVRFGVMSVLSFIINVGGTYLLHELAGLPVQFAYAIALATVFATNFLLMRLWVFDGARRGSGKKQAGGFLQLTVSFRVAEWLVFVALVKGLSLPWLPCVIGISIVATILKYVANRALFTDDSLSDEPAQPTPWVPVPLDRPIWHRSQRSVLAMTLLFAGLLCGLKLVPAVYHEHRFHDDAGQHTFWAQQAWDGDPTRYSEVARYFASEAAAPVAYHWTMRALAALGDVQLAADTLNVFVVFAMAVALGLLCARIAGSIWAAPLVAAVFFLIFPTQRIFEITFLQRTLALPIVLLGLYGLVARQMMWTGLSLVIAAVYYPIMIAPVGAIGAAHELILLARTRKMPPGWVAGFLLGVAAIVLVQTRAVPSEYGPMVSFEQAKAMPIFSNEGRSSIFLDDKYRYWFTGSRTGIGFRWWELIVGVATLLATVAVAGFKRIPLIVWVTIGVSLLLYAAAHATMFALYLPNRHTRITLPAAWFMLLGIFVIALGRKLAASNLPTKLRSRPAAAIVMTGICLLVLFVGAPDAYAKMKRFQSGTYTKVNDFLRQTPPSTLVAGQPTDLNNITLQTGRPALISRETTQAYYLGFYNDVVLPRLRDTTAALYATNWKEVDQLHDRYGVRLFYLRPHHYKHLPWARPFRNIAADAVADLNGQTPVLYDPPADRIVFSAGDVYLIRVGPPFADGEMPTFDASTLPELPDFAATYEPGSPPPLPIELQ